MRYSVIIPLYNKEKYIQRAIKSVLSQTISGFELIIVDDGSTDGSYQAASEIQDERIRIIRQTNQGVSAARNRGVEEARSEWVAFLDADDEWLPEFLGEIDLLHWEFPVCGFLATKFSSFENKKIGLSGEDEILFPLGWKGVIENFYEMLSKSMFCSSSIAVQRDLLLKIGGFPQSLSKGEDTNTWIRLNHITRIGFVNRVCSIYHNEVYNQTRRKPTIVNGDTKNPYSHVLLVHGYLKGGLIPKAQRQFAIDFMAKNDLPVSQQLIDQGYRFEAFCRLWLYRKTRRYKHLWFRTIIKSLLPSVVLRAIKE